VELEVLVTDVVTVVVLVEITIDVLVEVTITVLVAAHVAPLKLYRSNRFGPPQVSDAFPAHATLQPTLPSLAGPPPLERKLPHPEISESLIREGGMIG
jgi:hypothetical protein